MVTDSYGKNNSVIEKIDLYNVGVYCRLSKEDRTKLQSESIDNQEKILTEYVISKGWNIHNIYIDDGYTGTNFKRPGFAELIKDIEKGEVNLVITKDLSRFGREHIESGNYMQIYFLERGVRYIALGDNVDISDADDISDYLPYQLLNNEQFAKDTSRKVRMIFGIKMKNGEFIGAYSPYGYQKQGKNKLVIDEKVADVVRKIFNLYTSGKSMRHITSILIKEKIQTPIEYKQTYCNYKNPNSKNTGLWNQSMVKTILKDEVYIGNLIRGKQKKISYKHDKIKRVPKEKWIKVENTHEAIIEKEQFYLVQEMMKNNVNTYTKIEGAEHLLNNLTFCKECGSKLTYRNSRGKMTANCSLYSKLGTEYCTSHMIYESNLNEYVVNDLKRIVKRLVKEDFYNKYQNLKVEEKKEFDELHYIEIRINEIKNQVYTLYKDKLNGTVTEEIFRDFSNSFNEEREKLTARHKILVDEQKENEAEKEKDCQKIIREIVNFEKLDKAITCQLIKRVEVDKNRDITIYYKFDNSLKEPSNIN